MKILCECNSRKCNETVDIDDDLHISLRRRNLIVISHKCLRGPEKDDTLVEEKEGYSIYQMS